MCSPLKSSPFFCDEVCPRKAPHVTILKIFLNMPRKDEPGIIGVPTGAKLVEPFPPIKSGVNVSMSSKISPLRFPVEAICFLKSSTVANCAGKTFSGNETKLYGAVALAERGSKCLTAAEDFFGDGFSAALTPNFSLSTSFQFAMSITVPSRLYRDETIIDVAAQARRRVAADIVSRQKSVKFFAEIVAGNFRKNFSRLVVQS